MKYVMDKRVAAEVKLFYADPLGYVMFAYPWDSYEPIMQCPLPQKYRDRFKCDYGPDLWACEFLDRWGEEIKDRGFNGRDPVAPIQFTTVSGHGVGKTCLAAFITNFIMDTRPLSKGTITATTADQLRTKTWAEVGKWRKLGITRGWFIYSDTRGNMTMKHPELGMEWSVQAITCKEGEPEAFQGQHAVSSTSWYLYDEASGVPPSIFSARIGGLASGSPMTFDFGNGTRNSGDFFENCVGKNKHRFIQVHVDCRTAHLPNKNSIKQDIAEFGPDSDRVKVKWLGLFPSQGNAQFIAAADVRMAELRPIPPHNRVAKRVMGVDCGGEGASADDTVIMTRKGNDAKSFPPLILQGLDQLQIAQKIIQQYQFFANLGDEPAAIFVDGTGGYGGGVIPILRAGGYPVIEVSFGRSASDKKHYKYVVDEIWGRMKEDIRMRLALWSSAEDKLFYELTQREYGHIKDTEIVRLESKVDMKARGVPSPNIADALATTYYMEMADVSLLPRPKASQRIRDYDPLESIRAD